jgi:hypothetical protein
MVKRIMKYAGEQYSFETFKALDKESLPAVHQFGAASPFGMDNLTGSSPFDQRPPKFMGETPSFDKNKF